MSISVLSISAVLRRVAPVVVAALGAVGLAGLPAAPAAAAGVPATAVPAAVAAAVPDPVAGSADEAQTVAADALPTVQINGVVWSQAVVGSTVYVGGSFTKARPAGSPVGKDEVDRGYLLAYDITTGNLVASFNHTLDGQVRAVAASPDGTRVYVAGDFAHVDGQWRMHVAAFSTADGSLVAGFAPVASTTVLAVAATNTTVYVGGNFTQVGQKVGGTLVGRSYLAAFAASDGAVRDFRADTNAPVTALAVTAAGDRLAVGGRFRSLSGTSVVGLGSVDPTTGAAQPFPVNAYVRNATTATAITSLYADETGIYGTGYDYDQTGTLEGTFRADASTGAMVWIADCYGDTYGVFQTGGVVYDASHHHDCSSTPGGFPEVTPRTHHRAGAFTIEATGVDSGSRGYSWNHKGEPAPTMLNWYPDMDTGTASGAGQGPWNITGDGRYLSYGGEFLNVNGQPQQGLVRFAVRSLANNTEGPRLSGSRFDVTLASNIGGTVRASVPTNWDRDDLVLTYRLYRDSEQPQQVVAEKQVASPFFQPSTVVLADTTATPGSSTKYMVTVADPSGNVVRTSWKQVTVSSAAASGYAKAVSVDGPSLWWRLSDAATSTTAQDWAGTNTGHVGTGVTFGQAGAIAKDSSTAASFDGTANGLVAASNAVVGPDVFSQEVWFSTTTTAGGKIIGLGDKASGTSSTYDRHLYLTTDGRLNFGVYVGQMYIVTSPAAYNDGAWHHAVSTLGPDGMRLYVDGSLVASGEQTKGQAYTGYWRLGGDSPWSGATWFTGEIDEAAIYPTVLTPEQVQAHWLAGTGHNIAPTASFTATATYRTVVVDGAGSADPDGTIASYAWDFGDHSPAATGAVASHTYDAAGTYQVTLTVTDDQGATHAVTQAVTVTDPPADGVLAQDSFGRTWSKGWGQADKGGAWTVTSPNQYAVADGRGTQLVGPAQIGTATLGSVLSDATDVTLTLGADQVPGGGGSYTIVRARQLSPDEYYGAQVRMLSSGAVDLQLMRSGTSLGGGTVPGLTMVAGTGLAVRVQVGGTSPTTLKAKVWKAGTPEPTVWTRTTTDAQESLQYAGAVGLSSYLSGSAPTAVTFTVDDLLVKVASDDPVPVQPATASDTFDRTLAQGWGSADTGGAWMLSSAASNFAVADGAGVMLVPAGALPRARLGELSVRDADVTASFGLTPMADAGTTRVRVSARQSDWKGDYSLVAAVAPNGQVTSVSLTATVNGAETSLAQVPVTGLTLADGQSVTMRLRALGADPTTLQGRLWQTGTAEPTTWAVTATDAQPSLQAAGGAGVGVYVSAATTNVPLTVRWRDVAVTKP